MTSLQNHRELTVLTEFGVLATQCFLELNTGATEFCLQYLLCHVLSVGDYISPV